MDEVERMERAVVEQARDAAITAARGVLEASGFEPRQIVVAVTTRGRCSVGALPRSRASVISATLLRRRLTLVCARGSR